MTIDSEVPSVRQFWQRLDLPGIIDVHTHFMPTPVLNKVWAYFDGCEQTYGRAWPITYRLGADDRVALLREFGVLTHPALNYPHKADMAQWLNQWSAGFAQAHPDSLHSATFFPEPGAAQYVREAIDAGAQVFKAHLQVGDYDANDPLLDGVWDLLEQNGTAVVLHAGHGPMPGTFTGPAGVRRLLDRHPGLVLVIAHLGLPDYSEFLDLAEQHAGVHLDTTMAFTDFTEETDPFPRAELGRLADLGDKILFGSDFPNIPYTYLHALESLERLDLGPDWLRGVIHHNAARLFGHDGARD